MAKANRLIISIPKALRRVLQKASKRRGCSLAEIVRSALYQHLKEYITADDKGGAK